MDRQHIRIADKPSALANNSSSRRRRRRRRIGLPIRITPLAGRVAPHVYIWYDGQIPFARPDRSEQTVRPHLNLIDDTNILLQCLRWGRWTGQIPHTHDPNEHTLY